MKKKKIIRALLIILFWMLGVNFLTLFSIYSIKGYLYFAGIEPGDIQHKMAGYWLGPSQFLEAFLFGSFFGLLFVGINGLSDRFHWDRWSFMRVIIVKSALYVLGFLSTFFVIFHLINAMGFYPPDILTVVSAQGWAPMFALIGIFLLFNIVLLNYVIQTNKKIGEFSLISFLTGKYREPVVENRIFMFVDLKSSTTIAEQLGSVRYSSLIRDCFRDLNLIVRKYPVEIYQYVGDEAVLTCEWKADSVGQMIALFFQFRKRLERRKVHYDSKYDCVPSFKAGVHGGEVTTTEVGTLRRHIAFHGDVLNTTSRIQHKCNELGELFLVSEQLFDSASSTNGYEGRTMGEFELTGKKERVSLVAVQEGNT